MLSCGIPVQGMNVVYMETPFRLYMQRSPQTGLRPRSHARKRNVTDAKEGTDAPELDRAQG